MTQQRAVLALWLVFAGVAWNVIFDRLVWTAAMAFTREQVVRYQNRQPLTSIHDGFSPEVGTAALQATLWTLPIVGVGAAAVAFGARRRP